jgi:hypothetical protein
MMCMVAKMDAWIWLLTFSECIEERASMAAGADETDSVRSFGGYLYNEK